MQVMMPILQFMIRLLRIPRRVVRESIMLFQMVRFSLFNLFGQAPVIQAGAPVVSLTTYGKRIKTVHLAIESIANGSVRPSRLILWIDDLALFNHLPSTIRRLQKRGLEVRLCKNYGPHKKYYPYVESQDAFDVPLVTADDDFIYPHNWLEKLVDGNRNYPDAVNCFWSHVVALNTNGFEPYKNWQPCTSTVPRFGHVAGSGAGVIHPPSLLMALKRAGTAFEACCPRADDIWLHVQALRSGHRVRQIVPKLPYLSFRGIPGTQHTALSRDNVDGSGNDLQIEATYTEEDIEVLRTDCMSTLHREFSTHLAI